MKGIIAAFRTLTIIPLPGEESKELSNSLPWFPVVGLFLGLVLYLMGYVWTLLPIDPWPAGAALLMVAVEVWLTRGLHLDGLADWADSIGGFRAREDRLAIMKDARLGAFGGLALILALMAKWLTFERLLSSGSILWILPIFGLSRDVMVSLTTTLPYARSEEGMAWVFVKGSSPRHRLGSHALALGLSLFFGPVGLALFGLAIVMTWMLRGHYRNHFGGITGDLLGTANTTVEIVLLMICAVAGKSILSYTGWAWVWW